ncbi:unnamed protein product, partial [Allacma fusca]
MRGFSSVNLLSLAFSIVLFLTVTTKFGYSQYLNPKLNDKNYLDSLQKEVSHEVQESKVELLEQAKVVQHVTRTYIAARLKQNLFKALRVLAEKELALDAMTMQERPRQPRQEEETAAGGAGDDDEEPNTTRKPSQILPQVANLIKAVFGGNINLTSYVESAATYLPRPIGNQLVGVVKLLANNPGSKYTTTTTTTTTPATTSINTTRATEAPTTPVQVKELETSRIPPVNPPLKNPIAPAKEEDEDEDENEAKVRQLEIPGLDIIGNIGNNIAGIFNAGNAISTTLEKAGNNDRIANIGNALGTILHPNNIADTIGGVFQNGQVLENIGSGIGTILSSSGELNNSNKNKEKQKEKSKESDKKRTKPTNQTTSGFDEETSTARSMENKMNGIDVGNLAKEVRNSIGDLIKVMPDLFRGAHEAYKLL